MKATYTNPVPIPEQLDKLDSQMANPEPFSGAVKPKAHHVVVKPLVVELPLEEGEFDDAEFERVWGQGENLVAGNPTHFISKKK